jgi:hypothetical protein
MPDRYDQLLARIKEEIPEVKIIKFKDSWFIRMIHVFLKILTFGKFEPDTYTTTIGTRMYVRDSWDHKPDQEKYLILRHEVIHMRQARRWPFPALDRKGTRWINFFLFSFCYLFAAPTKWTLRAKFEREAYTQTLLTHFEIAGKWYLHMIEHLVAHMGKTFSGPDYFFMWDKMKAMKWAAQTMVDIEERRIVNDRDRVDLE